MSRQIRVESLPVTAAFRRIKRWTERRGEVALIEDGLLIQHLAVFSLRAGPGLFRGGHYHRVKTERFYVISGKVRILTVDVETGEAGHTDVQAGHKLVIPPLLAHRFHALEDAWLVEYYDSPYDPQDDVPFQPFPEIQLSRP
ncbi:Cupin [Desulfacinum hydrothermale DSM 13146]|uniref:Cupin n=1 Tax=Desulfacinum hydrothermale DSM 13146 TaxID=1121390 RepID=A0A1W1XGF7_9BACT|nr:cupin domain-containing protein [Desulfacinum hydrothermale]SMC22907.1 Cupin [Desulfacinum hydrothermale DSM 13146]